MATLPPDAIRRAMSAIALERATTDVMLAGLRRIFRRRYPPMTR